MDRNEPGQPDAILLVDHGSRLDEANEVVVEIARRLQAHCPDQIVRPCHCELADPLLVDVIAECIAEGARSIVVQPYYLVPGRHSGQDIPRLLAEQAAQHPGVHFRIGAPLGVHDGLVAVLTERIAAATPLR